MGIYKKYVAATLAALMMLAPTAALAQAFTRGSDIFDDVPVGHWADRAIGWAVGSEIVPMGNEVRFDLNGPVSRSEIVSLLHRLAEIHIAAPDVGNGDIAVIADDPDPLDQQRRLVGIESQWLHAEACGHGPSRRGGNVVAGRSEDSVCG